MLQAHTLGPNLWQTSHFRTACSTASDDEPVGALPSSRTQYWTTPGLVHFLLSTDHSPRHFCEKKPRLERNIYFAPVCWTDIGTTRVKSAVGFGRRLAAGGGCRCSRGAMAGGGLEKGSSAAGLLRFTDLQVLAKHPQGANVELPRCDEARSLLLQVRACIVLFFSLRCCATSGCCHEDILGVNSPRAHTQGCKAG